ncbi:hypothetical protein [Lysobacter gummosus]
MNARGDDRGHGGHSCRADAGRLARLFCNQVIGPATRCCSGRA